MKRWTFYIFWKSAIKERRHNIFGVSKALVSNIQKLKHEDQERYNEGNGNIQRNRRKTLVDEATLGWSYHKMSVNAHFSGQTIKEIAKKIRTGIRGDR